MAVCEFLHCTLTELGERIKNPANYYTILAYLHQKGARIKAEGDKARGN